MVNRIVFQCLCIGALLGGVAGLGLCRVRAPGTLGTEMKSFAELFHFFPPVHNTPNPFCLDFGPFSVRNIAFLHHPIELFFGIPVDDHLAGNFRFRSRPCGAIVTNQNWHSYMDQQPIFGFHGFHGVSKRARRQAPGVLEPREKRQNIAIFNGGILPLVCAVLPIGVTAGLDNTARLSDAAAMTYTGGKNGAGVYQRIINLMPPHRVYIEPFLGSGAILRLKRPAEVNIGLDLDAEVISYAAGITAGCDATGQYRQVERGSPATRIELADASSFLKSYPWRGDELVYCDPPYLLSTRKTIMRDAYPFEMRDVDHREFLRCIRMVGHKAKVLISGYWSEMYAGALEGWNSTQFQAMTRGGTLATEWLWFNYPEPTVLHDYSYLGANYRERERIKRKKRAWVNRLAKMPRLERQSLLAAFNDVGSTIDESGSARVPLAGVAGEDLTTRLTDGAPCPETPVQGETAERSL